MTGWFVDWLIDWLIDRFQAVQAESLPKYTQFLLSLAIGTVSWVSWVWQGSV